MYLTSQDAARAANDWATRPPDDRPIQCYMCDEPIQDGDRYYSILGDEICANCIGDWLDRHSEIMR